MGRALSCSWHPRRAPIPHLLAIHLLLGCGLDPYQSKDVGATDGDTGPISQPDAGDPPVLEALEAYRNEDAVEIRGLASEDDTQVTITIDSPNGATTTAANVESDGSFAATVTLERGVKSRVAASTTNGSSSIEETTVCDPWDRFEIDASKGDDYGDSCSTNPVLAEQQLRDAGATVELTGNVLQAGDEDFYQVYAVDEPILENSVGIEDFDLRVQLTEGANAYAFTVFKDGCDVAECPEVDSYDEYSFFSEDDSPDEDGGLPDNLAECGDPPLNECADYSGTWTVRVWRVDGNLDCTHYVLEISNGVGG